MKIAFVNQPTDTIIPPNQNSVGACTLGLALSLARSANVLVYGLKDNHSGQADLAPGHGIEFRFIPSTWQDRALQGTLLPGSGNKRGRFNLGVQTRAELA
jgi:hypothetical protein